MNLQEAVRLQRAGRAGEAAAVCRGLLEREPGNAVVWHLLGLAECQQGRVTEGVEALRRGWRDAPDAGGTVCGLAEGRRCGGWPR